MTEAPPAVADRAAPPKPESPSQPAPAGAIAKPAARQQSLLVPLQVPDKAVANLVVHWGDDFQLSAAHPAGELLLKIASALNGDVTRLGFFRSENAMPDVTGLGNPVFWFGDRSPAPDGAYSLPSLQSMLDDPSRKRQAWAVLKPWSERLG